MKRLRSTFSIELLLLAVSLLPACASDSYGAGTFFVLSEAGRTLTAVSLNGMETFARVVEGFPETLLDTSHNRVGTLAWTAGPRGVIARGGASLDAQARIQAAASALAVDPRKPGRSYARPPSRGRVSPGWP